MESQLCKLIGWGRIRRTVTCSEHGSLVSSTWAAYTGAVRVEEANSVVVGDISGSEGQEMGSISKKDHHRECVAEQKLSDACENEKHAAKPDVDRGCRN
jgi:hypothetical protein